MKNILFSVSLLLTVGWVNSQSDAHNSLKYWKFRTDFKEKYVKIGPEEGESLPAGALKPIYCPDNLLYDGNDGEMHWGRWDDPAWALPWLIGY